MTLASSFEIPFDTLHEECGLFGVLNHAEAIPLTTLGLHALQHRGQEGAGIAGLAGEVFHVRRKPGLVGDVFSQEKNTLADKNITTAIGHVRYSTAGGSDLQNLQPFTGETIYGPLAIAHNGNLTNGMTLRQQFLQEGRTFQSTSDTEVILHAIAVSGAPTLKEAIIRALAKIEGAYSLLILGKNELFALRDPAGVRPLILGQLDGQVVIASETCAFDIIGATYERDIRPGEIVHITDRGMESTSYTKDKPSRFCIFEYIYFMHPTSAFAGKNVSHIRERIGAELFRESHTPADMVVPIPDSGVYAAVGYAQTANIPYKQSIVRSRYVGRTFIEPAEKIRHLGVKLKLSVNRADVVGRRVILVDDSIVRGTTMPKIVDIMRRSGATEVHVRISSPPFANPCFYGIDTPSRAELIASNHDVDAMCEMVGADSLAFISLEGLYRAVGSKKRDHNQQSFCDACFTGNYTLPLIDVENKNLKDKDVRESV